MGDGPSSLTTACGVGTLTCLKAPEVPSLQVLGDPEGQRGAGQGVAHSVSGLLRIYLAEGRGNKCVSNLRPRGPTSEWGVRSLRVREEGGPRRVQGAPREEAEAGGGLGPGVLPRTLSTARTHGPLAGDVGLCGVVWGASLAVERPPPCRWPRGRVDKEGLLTVRHLLTFGPPDSRGSAPESKPALRCWA